MTVQFSMTDPKTRESLSNEIYDDSIYDVVEADKTVEEWWKDPWFWTTSIVANVLFIGAVLLVVIL